MPKTKMSDLQVLRSILGMPDGKLAPGEKRAFQAMYDNVAAGMVIQLSKKQRLWADSVFDKHKLDGVAPVKAVVIKDKQLLKPPPTR
jgi:hypothetical protein